LNVTADVPAGGSYVEVSAVDRFIGPPVFNTRGEQFGVVRPRIELEAVDG
jgi:hypothetical protein